MAIVVTVDNTPVKEAVDDCCVPTINSIVGVSALWVTAIVVGAAGAYNVVVVPLIVSWPIYVPVANVPLRET